MPTERDNNILDEGLLKLDDGELVALVKDMVVNSEHASNAMCLVAFANLPSYTFAIGQMAKKHPDLNFPTTFEGYVRHLLANDAPDEVNRRRRLWFLFALLIKHAGEMAESTTEFESALATIWKTLADSAKYLPALLEHNVVWSELEKEWFAPIKTEADAIEYVLNWMMPKSLSQYPEIQAYASKYKIRSVGNRFVKPSFDK